MSVALTRSRCINALKCYASYALSLLGSVRIVHRPIFVSVEPAAVCQLRCPECPVGNAKLKIKNYELKASPNERLMPREVWERVLSETGKYALTMQFYFQGEPLLNKELPQMIREAHEAGLYTIVSTNAQTMTQELAEELVQAGLSRIIVSMDGLTQASYEAYRIGGKIEQCKAALRFLREAKLKIQNYELEIELQCLRLKTNEQEWKVFRKAYKQLGADRLVFKTAQLYDYTDGHPLMPSNPRYSRYIQGEDGKYHRRKLGRGCLRVWSGVVVTTNGEVLPCCYDKSHSHAYGNIMKKGIEELFSNESSIAFRKAALQEKPNICKECYK